MLMVSIQYKKKPYSSASEALEAYIDDFHLSCELPEINDTKVNLDLGASWISC